MVLKNRNKHKRFIVIGILLVLLALTFLFREIIPPQIGDLFNRLDQKSSNTLSQKKTVSPAISDDHNTELEKKRKNEVLNSLCTTNNQWPEKEVLLKSIFPENDYQQLLVSENIFYKKKGLPLRIVRKTNQEIILFQEDEEGFPSPVEIDEFESQDKNSHIIKFIAGYQKHIVQRLIEFTNEDQSLVVNIEDGSINEIKLDSNEYHIECEDEQCRCDF